MPSRNLRRVAFGLAGLLGLAALGLWLAQSVGHQSASQPGKEALAVTETTIKIVGEPQRLVPGTPLEAELAGGQGRVYEAALQAGEYIHVVVEQKGIDLALRRVDAADEPVRQVDTPHGAQGPEDFFLIADSADTLRLQVICEDATAEAGAFAARIAEQRPATAADRQRLQAWERFLEAEKLRRQGTGEASRQAIAIHREILPIWRQLRDETWEAESLYRIGWLSDEQGEHDAALAAFEEVLPLLARLGRKQVQGIVLNRQGAILFRRAEWEKARASHEAALALFREIGQPSLEASALNNLGNLLVHRGDPTGAQQSFQQALERARAGKAPWEEASALHGIAEVLTFQGRLEAAADAYRKTLRIQERIPGTEADQAETLSALAGVSQRLERLDEALAGLSRALALRRRTGDRDGESTDLNTLGTLHLRRGEPEKARESYERALALSGETKNRFGEGFSLLNLGRYYFEIKNYKKALEAHEEAAALFHSIGHRRGEVSTLYGSARALHKLGDYAAALERLERVLPDVEALRSESEGLDARSSYFATKQHYIELQIDVLMHLAESDPKGKHAARAIEVDERRRARSLLDLLGESRAKIRRDADPRLIAREAELVEQISATERDLLKARQQGNRGRAEELTERQRSLLGELDTARAQIREKSPRYAALVQPRPLSLAQIRWMLDEETLLLVFSLAEERSFLWLIPNRGPIASRVLASRSTIETLAQRAWAEWSRSGASERAEDQRWARRLSDELLGKVGDRLRVRRLVIVADGALQGLPFAALPMPARAGQKTAREPLVAQHEIVSLPSMSALAALRDELKERVEASAVLAVLADPVFGPDDPRLAGKAAPDTTSTAVAGDLARAARDTGIDQFPRLPHTAAEAETIASLVKGDERKHVLLGFDASLDAVRSGALRRYRYIHFATHGLLNPKHPELSGLVLSLYDREGRTREGFLFGHEICNLELPAELVVLSACETGRGGEIRGEGIVGLSRSFMYAGTPRLVVSLWKVSDEGTAELMKRFYRAMFQHHLAPSAALRCAQLSLQQQPRWSSPFYWAPFVFLGEWNRVVQEGPPDDDDIEAPKGGTNMGGVPPDDLPPPSRPPHCPPLN